MENAFALPRVSVIMPALNSGKYIAQAIGSVQAQTFERWELLIVDNGSTDDTRSVAQQFAAADPRIRVIVDCVEHSVGMARSRALQSAHGEWVAFLDSDDVWQPEKLERQLRAAKEKSCGFLFCASSFMDDAGNPKSYVLHVPERVRYPQILKQNIISCSSVLVKRKLLRGCFLERSNGISDDFAAWIRILRDHGVTAVGIDEPLLCYRVSHSSLSANKLRAALRCYRTYRHVGLSVPKALYYWCHYVLRSLRKYSQLYPS